MARLAVLVSVVAAAAVGGAVGLRPAGVGEPGIGDAYFPGAGNGGYDVTRYDIELEYDPPTDRLTGRTTVTAVASRTLREFFLDLRVPATAVTVDDQPATIVQRDGELRITPAEPVAANSTVRIVVGYSGVPSSIAGGSELGAGPWQRTPDGALGAGEPEIAAWWFPANDHPSDKAAVAVTVTVPAGVEAISNGALLGGPEPRPDGRDRWRWSADEPMAPYLAFVAIGQYDLVRRDTPFGPYLAAYQRGPDPLSMAIARRSVERTPEVVDVLDDILGPYPFGQLGGVVTRATFPALENQTRPVYGLGMFGGIGDPDAGFTVVVHEVAHQWFGDSVSLARWRDIWLNEGLATYLEWLYVERTGGDPAAVTAERLYQVLGDPRAESFWRVPPGDPGPGNLFDEAVYVRGGLAVQAIRAKIGDPAFFTLLRTWADERAGGNGSVPDFLATAERVSGVELDDVAREWLAEPDRPPSPPGGS